MSWRSSKGYVAASGIYFIVIFIIVCQILLVKYYMCYTSILECCFIDIKFSLFIPTSLLVFINVKIRYCHCYCHCHCHYYCLYYCYFQCLYEYYSY